MDSNKSEVSSPSNLTAKSYGPDTDFGYVCTVNLTLEIWPRVKVMTHHWVMDNNCVKYYPDPAWQWGVMAQTQILGMFALWPWPWRYDLESRSLHTLGFWTTIVWNIIQTQPGSEELWRRHPFFGMCALWPWPWRYDLESRSWHTLGSRTITMWNIIQIQHGSEELWPWHGLWVCVPCDLKLGDMTLGQGHDTLGSWTTIVWNIIQIRQEGKKLWPGTWCEQGWGYNKRPKGPHILHLSTMCHLFWGIGQGGNFCFPIGPEYTNLVEDVDLASCQVSLNFIQWFQRRSPKCLSQSEARAAILFFRSARKTQTW